MSLNIEKARHKVAQFKLREKNILSAALELLLKYGEDKVTVEQIADAVDIGKGTVYKHFQSKSEIFISLVLAYECELIEKLDIAIELIGEGDRSAAARLYFKHRIGDPRRSKLFQRLEERLISQGEESEKLTELASMRKGILARLSSVSQKQIDMGILKKAPPEYYNLAYWALTHGAVELHQNSSVLASVVDIDELMDFIMEVGVRMGLQDQS